MLVAEGLGRLRDDVRAACEHRAAAQVREYLVILPGWHEPHDVDALPDDVFDRLVDLLRDVPCPALDAAGSCVIHAHRPATCRLMGRSWRDDASGDVLDNDCPIQDRFAGYVDAPPTILALGVMENALGALDEAAAASGHVRTTVAGAVAAAHTRLHRPRR